MLKNAVRSILHDKGQTILTGILVLLAAALSVIALTVRKAADGTARFRSFGDMSSPASLGGGTGTNVLAFLIAALVVIAAAAALLGVFRVRRRRAELGTLAVIGARRGKAVFQLAAEVFLVAFAGALIGTAVGFATAAPAAGVILSTAGRTDRTNGDFPDGQTFGNRQNGNPADGSQSESSRSNVSRTAYGSRGNGTYGSQNGGDTYYGAITAAPDPAAVPESLAVGLALALLAGVASAAAAWRYDPINILSRQQ